MAACGIVASCGRNAGHRGHHGGFVPMVGKAESRLPTEREAFYTPTEREVLRLYALGLTRAASAQRMDIAQHTVTNHRSNIVSKTPGAACMVDALRFIGWLQPPA